MSGDLARSSDWNGDAKHLTKSVEVKQDDVCSRKCAWMTRGMTTRR